MSPKPTRKRKRDSRRVVIRKAVQIGLLILKLMMWFCFFVSSAVAAPQLGLSLERTEAPLNLGDERLVYEATVTNEASDNPKFGDELACRGTPEDGVSWGGSPAPTFAFKWLRDGEVIGGATSKVYTVAAADEGKSVQCVVTGSHDPDGGGGIYAPIGVSVASAPVAVDPPPATAAPSGSERPQLSGPPFISATPSGTATATNGSKLLTEAVTAKGTGTLSSGSKTVTGVSASAGAFERQQAITGPGIPAKTRIDGLVETALGVFEITLSNAATLSGSQPLAAGAQPFGVGHEISGECVPADAEIIGATNQGSVSSTDQAIEMDQPATCSKVGAAITATSTRVCSAPSGWTAGTPIVWSFQWLRNGQPIPGATSAAYTVTTEDTEPTSTLQCEAIAEDEAGAKAIAISLVSPTAPRLPAPYQEVGVGSIPVIDFANQTTGTVTVKLVLPEGPGTYAFKATSPGNHWTCTKTAPTPTARATVTCDRSDSLSPGEAYEPVEVVIALGKNPPTQLVTEAELEGGNSGPDSAADEYTIPFPRVPFGFKAFKAEALDELGNDYTKAGGHPFTAGASIEFNTHARAEIGTDTGTVAVNGLPRVIRTDPPRGFIGNPQAVDEFCPTVSDILAGTCPAGSVVGAIASTNTAANFKGSPIFAIEPERGVVAQFAFEVSEFVFTLVPELLPDEDGYAIRLVTAPLSKTPEIFTADVKLCSFGAKNIAPEGESVEYGCREASDPGATQIPFLTNPTRCSGGPPVTTISADSWEEPGVFTSKSFTAPALTECDGPKFEPEITLTPTSRQADSPTGMNVEIKMPTEGLEDPFGTAEAHLKSAKVTLPVGMAVNPAAANGLGACGLSEIGISPQGVPNNNPVSCPESSKVATVEAETPLLDETLKGNVYIARQNDNPFNSLLALYMVIDSPENGILVKLAGRVSPDPITGQLTVSFDDNPEVPVKSVRLKFDGGQRAALINPPLCGNYGAGGLEGISAELSPWTAADPENPTPAETVSSTSPFVIDQGPGGGPCPSGALEPKLKAGLDNPTAGAVTPFVLDLSRADGTQRFRAVEVTMPKGLVAYLKGVPYCPEATLAQIPTAAGTGAAQVANPSCPAASRVGTVVAGAGAGSSPFYLDTGRAYLAGPYKGAPLSLAIVNPAVAGPFDLGNVVVRTALRVNSETAEITAVSDPLPTIIEGIPLDVRDIRVNVDRPNFTLAPTNCEPSQVSARVTGEKGAVATTTDRFQVGGCEKLGFKPNLALRLKGKTRRGAYQRLTATVTYPKGAYANIASAAVTFPRSIFLAQEHIRTICTRVQFAADTCPPGSIYGSATATSPLVDYPLEGKVYLRSSSNPLPDLVVALRGPAHQPLEIDLAGRVDSKNGGIRNTFTMVPDAPVSKFTLRMRGGKKSLLVTSRNICADPQRATVKMTGQNGRRHDFRPVIKSDCGGKGKSKSGKGKGGKG